MRHLGLFLFLLAATLTCLAWGDSSDDVSCSPKLSALLSNGILKNQGTLGGSSVSLGGLNFAFEYFLNPKISVGVGYHVDLDFQNKTLPLSGFDISGRWYFSGEGTTTVRKYDSITTTSHDLLAFFTGVDFAQRNYYTGATSTSSTSSLVSGSSLGINLALGSTLHLSRHFDLLTEASVGALTFAASDPRVSISGYLLNIGLSYIW